MTHRRDLERHRNSLAQIREIMSSMRTLAYMETRKLARFLGSQQAVVRSIEGIAADFVGSFPETLPETGAAKPVYLLIGTERGFCGAFNHDLVEQLDGVLAPDQARQVALIAVGHKLHNLMQDDARLTAAIDGASVSEEVTDVLNEIVKVLASLQAEHGVLDLFCCTHNAEGQVTIQKLLPPFQKYLHAPVRFALPPVLNVPPVEFLVELTEQYLFAALHEILYTSLMGENDNRVAHLERAVSRLDEESEALTRRCNALRQEEIIEEIEVILLSTMDTGGPPRA